MREYHRSFRQSPHAVALVCDDAGQPAGFVVGTVGNRAHYRWVLRNHGWRLAMLALLGLVRHPWLLTTVARRRLVPYAVALGRMACDRRGAPAPVDGEGPVAVLTHVAVATMWQGNGMGGVLVDEFLRAAAERRAAVARLSTLSGSDGAAAFYLRRGWRHVTRARDWDGREITVLSRDLTPLDARPEEPR